MTTGGVARTLNKPYQAIYALLMAGTIPRPPRDESGRYRWGPEHIEAARRALADYRPRSPRVVAMETVNV